MKSNPTLLPVGFYDALPPASAAEARVVARFLKRFGAEGYEAVSPPLIEFENSLEKGVGASVAPAMFRLMDPLSHRMMGIRADMTPQIVRIADTLLKNKPRPLRLAYAGPVLRVSGEGLNPRRQLTQVGIELLGTEAVAADVEVVRIVAQALEKLDVPELTVDFSLPLILPLLLEAADIDVAVRKKILRAVEQKNLDPVRSLGGEAGKLLEALMRSAGPLATMLPKIKALKLPEAVQSEIDRLELVANALSKAVPDLNITLDVLENRGFDYHAGISFAFFSGGAEVELARGGRYYTGPKSRKKGGVGDAAGCSLSVEAVLSAIPSFKKRKKILVQAGISEAKRASLIKEKYIVIEALEKVSSLKAEAKRMKCSYMLQGEKIEPVA